MVETMPTAPPPPPPSADWALFLDVDGCLLDFADTPDGVFVPPELPVKLAALARGLDGALALVSGRSLACLDRLFAPLRTAAAGLHGIERRSADGWLRTTSRRDPALATIREEAGALLAAHPDAWIEDKGATLALHWRRAPQAAPALQAFAQAALARLPGYRLQPGDHVIELRPDGDDKGSAIAVFLEEPPFRGRLPVFTGDDRTDEHGFAVVNANGGISVLVGARQDSVARYRLPSPMAVREWLYSTVSRETAA